MMTEKEWDIITEGDSFNCLPIEKQFELVRSMFDVGQKVRYLKNYESTKELLILDIDIHESYMSVKILNIFNRSEDRCHPGFLYPTDSTIRENRENKINKLILNT